MLIFSDPLKLTPDKEKIFFEMLTVYQHPDLFLHAERNFTS